MRAIADVLLGVLTAYGLYAVDLETYRRTEPQHPVGFGGLPSWTLIGVILMVGVVSSVVIAARWTTMRMIFVPLIVVITVAVAWFAVVSVRGIPTPFYLLHKPTQDETIAARQTLSYASTGQCSTLRDGHVGELPFPIQRCSSGQPEPWVTYTEDWTAGSNTPKWNGLAYSTGPLQLNIADACVLNLGGGWWAFMGSDDPTKGCPTRFTFVGAP